MNKSIKENRDIVNYNNKDQRHGYFERYYYYVGFDGVETKQLRYKGFYINGRRNGYREEYGLNGKTKVVVKLIFHL